MSRFGEIEIDLGIKTKTRIFLVVNFKRQELF